MKFKTIQGPWVLSNHIAAYEYSATNSTYRSSGFSAFVGGVWYQIAESHEELFKDFLRENYP